MPNKMDSLDKLGGVEAATAYTQQTKTLGQGMSQMYEALIERIQSQERELKMLRKLRRMVIKDADSLECVGPGLAVVRQAREAQLIHEEETHERHTGTKMPATERIPDAKQRRKGW